MENRMSCSAGRSLRSPAAFWIAEASSSTTDENAEIEYARPGGIVNRNFLILGTAALALAGAVFAQDPPPAKSQQKSPPATEAARLRAAKKFLRKMRDLPLRRQRSEKIGPGLKGMSKRGTSR